MEPAPYGGFMTRTLDAEAEAKALLQKQEVAVGFNGLLEFLRPDTLNVHGVDNLLTEQIEAWANFWVNTDTQQDGEELQYKPREQQASFRVQWINDSSANLVFKSHADAHYALQHLCLWPGIVNEPEGDKVFSKEYLDALVEEREAREYAPSIAYYKQLQSRNETDLFAEKKAQIDDERTAMDEDGLSIVLHIRQAVQLDRKTKNAAAYSRYYLLHGEPDRLRPRRPRNERAGSGRGGFERDARDGPEDEDLFAAKLKTAPRDDEEDLFAHLLRDRSPDRR